MTTILDRRTPAQPDAPLPLTLDSTGVWQGRYRTDVAARDFAFTVAEPEGLGGDDAGPNPLEYVLGGFQGCVAVVVETVAKERGITIDDLRLGVSGTIDLRGFLGVPGVSPSFESIDGWVRLRADIDAEQFEGLVAETERRCPLYNLFRDAGVTPEIRWSLNV